MGDVNHDGFPDFLTNYEFDQRLVVAFHPGAHPDRGNWPAVTAWMPRPAAIGAGVNPENADLGDLDGDGHLDIVCAQGFSHLPFWEGSEPGIRVVWGPSPDRTGDESAWIDGGRIPATIDRGHLIYVVPRDVNGDGAPDIVAGGRVHARTKRTGGVIWIEAPRDPSLRRDLGAWRVHDIDPLQLSGHGLVPVDLDRDGDLDIALANADFDTPEAEEKILWYENPGRGTEKQKCPWPSHTIYQGPEFHGKPQIAAADLDGDGLTDLVTQVPDSIYFFRATALAPVRFERVVIPKHPAARFPGRTVRVADFNGDGRPDILGMLVHRDGTLPPDKAAVFWMEFAGAFPGPDNWTTHVIKWGSGRTMDLSIFGEKWDLAQAVDIDGDGDLDIAANCEEWWEADIEFRFFGDPFIDNQSVAVVWFENRLREPPAPAREVEGRVEVEAEDYAGLGDGTWIVRARHPGYAGRGYLQDHNRRDPRPAAFESTRGASYRFDLAGGDYRLRLRLFSPARWGVLGGFASDSLWAALDGLPLAVTPPAPAFGRWVWVEAGAGPSLRAGTHSLNLRVREGGLGVDRIALERKPPP
jgi:hypothetical protein